MSRFQPPPPPVQDYAPPRVPAPLMQAATKFSRAVEDLVAPIRMVCYVFVFSWFIGIAATGYLVVRFNQEMGAMKGRMEAQQFAQETEQEIAEKRLEYLKRLEKRLKDMALDPETVRKISEEELRKMLN